MFKFLMCPCKKKYYRCEFKHVTTTVFSIFGVYVQLKNIQKYCNDLPTVIEIIAKKDKQTDKFSNIGFKIFLQRNHPEHESFPRKK